MGYHFDPLRIASYLTTSAFWSECFFRFLMPITCSKSSSLSLYSFACSLCIRGGGIPRRLHKGTFNYLMLRPHDTDSEHVTVRFGKFSSIFDLWPWILEKTYRFDHVTVYFEKKVLIDLGSVSDWFSKSVGRP